MNTPNPIREFHTDAALEVWRWDDGVRIFCRRTDDNRRMADYVQYDDTGGYHTITEMRLGYADDGTMTYHLNCADMMGFAATYHCDGQSIRLQSQRAYSEGTATPLVTYTWHNPVEGKIVCDDPLLGSSTRTFNMFDEDVVYHFRGDVTSTVSKNMDPNATVSQIISMPNNKNYLLQLSMADRIDPRTPVVTLAMYVDGADKAIAATFNQNNSTFLRNTYIEQGLRLVYG